MNTFKKKALFAALAGLGAMGMVGSAQAVSLNPDGLGQVLIYPYYTVRDSANGEAFNSLISIVNSTTVGKAVKVRFLEGKFSQEVLDFNLYLSEWDVWTGAVVPTADGARLFTRDTSCTNPAIPAAGVDFRHYQYTQRNPDLEDQTLDRTREGYVEVIEMADFVRLAGNAKTTTEIAITHANVTVDGVTSWRPPNCGAINNTNMGNNLAHLTQGSGGLFGSMTLINPNEAQGFAYEAVALDAWNASGSHKWYVSGSINPHLGEVAPKNSMVINGPEVFITEDWTRGIDAVSAVLMNEAVYNEFMMEDEVAGKTDWVVTFPTKQHYYENRPSGSRNQVVTALFENNFVAGGACDTLNIFYTDREERIPQSFDDFSPTPIGGRNALCWEANVITFGAGATPILNSKNAVNLGVSGYKTGWAQLKFNPDSVEVTNTAGAVIGTRYIHQLIGDATGTMHGVAGAPIFTSDETLYIDLSNNPVAPVSYDTVTFTGLPMVGFAVQQFNNGEVVNAGIPGGKVWASYATRINHRFSKNIVPSN
ncbi:MAG: hypothetical protein FWC38_06390 [Proteobacteria bacterium]|nr:hypothetical protein [Pseudomonadota bacterium]MCL2307838.1 hypothetical protein [Pseudomonadota bacterium]